VFKRGKGQKGPVANQLSSAAEPNKLTWAADDADVNVASADAEFVEEDDVEEDELEDEELDEPTLARRQAELAAELQRQAEEFGLTGSNPTAVYGPNGEDVEAVLDALSEIDLDKAEQLADAWMAVDATDREILERDLLRRARNGKHSFELTAAEDSVTAWLNARTPADDEEAALWTIVAEAATGAVDALILDDDLDDVDYDLLYGAWETVMEAEEEDGDAEAEGETAGEGSDDDSAAEDEEADKFGPNTELVRQFLARLGELTPVQMTELTAFWNGQSKADLKQAHRAMQELAKEDETWRNQIRAAQEEISTWSNGPTVTRSPRTDQKAANEVDARLAALPPAVDAISALVLADLLEPEDAETLFAAWEATIGEPKLPEYEDDRS
jgi:hypothetical protein